MSITANQVLQFRLRAHHLDRKRPLSRLEDVAGACGLQNSPPGAWAVSYTHLDVYKRQALAWARVLPDAWAVLCIKANASILLFNLLPALPLDGGRALFGALNRPRAGVWAGRALACALCVLCVAGIVWQRRVNLTRCV